MPRSSASRADTGGFNPEEEAKNKKPLPLKKKNLFAKPSEPYLVPEVPAIRKSSPVLIEQTRGAADEKWSDRVHRKDKTTLVVELPQKEVARRLAKAKEIKTNSRFERVASAVLMNSETDPKQGLTLLAEYKDAILERSAKEADVEAQMAHAMKEIVKADKGWDSYVDSVAKISGYKDELTLGSIVAELNQHKTEILKKALTLHDRDTKKPLNLEDAIDLATGTFSHDIIKNIRDVMGTPQEVALGTAEVAAQDAVQALNDFEDKHGRLTGKLKEQRNELAKQAQESVLAWAKAAANPTLNKSSEDIQAEADKLGLDEFIDPKEIAKLAGYSRKTAERDGREHPDGLVPEADLDEIDPIDDIVAPVPKRESMGDRYKRIAAEKVKEQARVQEDPYAYARDIVERQAPAPVGYRDNPVLRADNELAPAIINDGSDGGKSLEVAARAAANIKQRENYAGSASYKLDVNARDIEERVAPGAFMDDLDGAGLEQRAKLGRGEQKPLSLEKEFFGRDGELFEGSPSRYDSPKPKAEPKPKSVFQRLADTPSSVKAAFLGGMAALGAMFFQGERNPEDIPQPAPYADVALDGGGMTMNDDASVAEYAAGREVQVGDMGKVDAGSDAGGIEVEQASKQQLERRAERAKIAQKKSFDALLEKIHEAGDQFEWDADDTTLQLAELLGTKGLKAEAIQIKAKRWGTAKDLLESFDDIIQEQEDIKVRAELREKTAKLMTGLTEMLAEKAAVKAKAAHDKEVAESILDDAFKQSGL